jgi:amino acid adenylation domain-containing protein
LRSRLNRGQEFHSFLTETRNQLFQGYKNQNIHFDQLVTSLKVKRNQNIHPIFQALFTIHTSYHEELDFNGLKIKFLEIEDNLAKFDLSLFCSENSNELTIKLVYAKDLYNESTIKIIAECYQHLLTQLLRDENILIENISLDTHQSSIQLNNFKTDDKESTLHALFARQVLLNPEKTASIWKEKEYSYREINDFANQFANYLQAKGIKPGEVIVTLLEPGAEIISCILGILKIGCVYLPIDFKYPEARILAIIRDAKPQLLIANQSNFFEKIASEVSLINLDVDARIIHQESKIFSADIRNQDNACIIYTSGSTGTPKGVICKHSSLINRIQWYWRTYPSKSDETCIFLANVSFVDSLGEIFAPLLHGVKLIIAPAQTPADPELLITYLTKYAVTRVCVVPSLLRILLENYPTLALVSTKLKHWEISGEEFPKDLILKTLRMLNNVRLINRYGSTEATSIIYNELTLDVNDTNQIIFKSQIIDNTVLLILDKNLVPLPNGLIGQLYVGGAPLANGYLNNPGLTNEKFINYESNNSFNGTIYKTGDSARLDQDGNIEIIGRLDRQIKINGFRVELGEIESMCCACKAS